MYFAYVDETGTDGSAPVLVMVGIVVNGERLNRTQEELATIFAGLSVQATGLMKELKGKTLLGGSGPWRRLDGEQRRTVVTNLCHWLVARKHTLALAAISHDCFKKSPPPGTELSTAWRGGAFHIALQLQRAHQAQRGSKGKTVLVFDDNKQEMDSLVDLIASPPTWSDDFYSRRRRDPPLQQLIDTPFAVKSHHVGLVQVADVFAYVFRRYTELVDYELAEAYVGERGHYEDWVQILRGRLISAAHRWPSRSDSALARWYTSAAPNALLELR